MSEAIVIETLGGDHIRNVLAKAVDAAVSEPVGFDFNGTHFVVEPGETYDAAKTRWEEATGIPILTREEELARIKADQEEREAAYETARSEAGVSTEAGMREADVPTPDTVEELAEYVAGLVDRPHDYGTCVYAMSMASVAAFNYVARKLGVTGFQAGCADMDILRRIRRMDDGFRIVNYADLIYPQYWDEERSPIYAAALKADPEHWLAKVQERMRESPDCATAVWHHWQDVAKRCNEALAARGALDESEGK